MSRSNIDADATVPEQSLRSIKRAGPDSAFFHADCYDDGGVERPDFVLIKEPYRYAKIPDVTGPNFGCGSYCERACWALLVFGITCVVASSCADIFFNSCFKDGISLSSFRIRSNSRRLPMKLWPVMEQWSVSSISV